MDGVCWPPFGHDWGAAGEPLRLVHPHICGSKPLCCRPCLNGSCALLCQPTGSNVAELEAARRAAEEQATHHLLAKEAAEEHARAAETRATELAAAKRVAEEHARAAEAHTRTAEARA